MKRKKKKNVPLSSGYLGPTTKLYFKLSLVITAILSKALFYKWNIWDSERLRNQSKTAEAQIPEYSTLPRSWGGLQAKREWPPLEGHSGGGHRAGQTDRLPSPL